jgi:uncharacterized protein
LKFEWDENKNLLNTKKHNISFEVARSAFYDENGFVLEDTEHSKEELRFYWIGKIFNEKIITIRFVFKENCIRIFGASEWRKFRRIYDERTKDKESKI